MSSYGAISKWPSGKWLPRPQKWMKKNSDKFHSPSDMLFRRFGGFCDPGDQSSQWKINSPKNFHAQGGRRISLYFLRYEIEIRLRAVYLNLNLNSIFWNPGATVSTSTRLEVQYHVPSWFDFHVITQYDICNSDGSWLISVFHIFCNLRQRNIRLYVVFIFIYMTWKTSSQSSVDAKDAELQTAELLKLQILLEE